MKPPVLLLVLLAALSACTPQHEPVQFSTTPQDKPESYKHPSQRMGFSDMPQRMPLMREKYYGPEGGCTVGRQTKGWC